MAGRTRGSEREHPWASVLVDEVGVVQALAERIVKWVADLAFAWLYQVMHLAASRIRVSTRQPGSLPLDPEMGALRVVKGILGFPRR